MRLSRHRILILLLSLVFISDAFLSMQKAPVFVYASETDKNKAITIFTEPGSPVVGQTAVTETGIGLDTLVTPANASGYSIRWESSDEDVATVDSTGHVHGTLTGKYAKSDKAKCNISAVVSLNGAESRDTIEVTVKRGYDIISVSMVPASLTLQSGKSYTLNVSYTSKSDVDTRTEFYFISSNPEVAFVDPDGKVTAKSAGEATITVYTLNGKYASSKVTVTPGSTVLNAVSDSNEAAAGSSLIICCDSSLTNKAIRNTLSDYNASYEASVKTSADEKAVLASCSEDTDIAGLMNKIDTDADIKYVQPNFTYSLTEADPYYNDIDPSESGAYGTENQYFHFQTQIDKAWELLESNGISQSTIVGVVDSGIDADHLDLAGNLILDSGKYTRFANGEKIQDTSDMSSRGHGTHVAGIIGAVYGNGLGGAGGASGKNNKYSRILPVGTVTDSSGTLNSYDVIKSINYAVQNGARVINLSFGGPYRDRLLGTCIQNHYYNNGIVFVAAAGNESTDYSNKTYDMSYPSDLKEVISVCNIDRTGVKHGSSNFGSAKDIAAPGVTIFSTVPDNKMASMTGTSMSSPVVSSVCALMLDANPDLTPDIVRNIICGTANDSTGYYRILELGYGSLNALTAVQASYDIRKGNQPSAVSISIKTPYRSKKATEGTEKEVSTSFKKVKSMKTSGKKNSAVLSFARSDVSVTTATKRISIDPYTGDKTTLSKTATVKTYKSGIRYKIAVRKKGSSKWKIYRIASKKKTTKQYKVTLSGNRLKIVFRKLTGGKTYYLKVQPYKTVNGEIHYGSWTKPKSVKTKKLR